MGGEEQGVGAVRPKDVAVQVAPGQTRRQSRRRPVPQPVTPERVTKDVNKGLSPCQEVLVGRSERPRPTRLPASACPPTLQSGARGPRPDRTAGSAMAQNLSPGL
ncbi:hypothetical protein J1605_010969 [Eschrichtius robustus]|uniref:Uncharacterized protein n=1 Tax=Eschrichtius robustus TaxID=9764 RepID=A0AB34GQA0_ESCRO|nr:hypothetical protein J1605_010969 [Eschrichtius robustus]